MLYLALFGSLVGFTAFIYLLKRVRPALATSYAYVNPVIAVLLGWLLLHEPVGPRTFIAMGMILVAVVWIQFSLKARRTVGRSDGRTDNASTVRRSDSPTVRPEPEAST